MEPLTATFKCVAQNVDPNYIAPITYTWYGDYGTNQFSLISTQSTLNITPIYDNMDNYKYYCVVSNGTKTLTSNIATLHLTSTN